MSKPSSFKTFYAISLAWQLGFLIIFPILGFGVIGFLIDTHLNSSYLYSSAGLLVGAVLAAYETFKMLEPFIVNKHKKYF